MPRSERLSHVRSEIFSREISAIRDLPANGRPISRTSHRVGGDCEMSKSKTLIPLFAMIDGP